MYVTWNNVHNIEYIGRISHGNYSGIKNILLPLYDFVAENRSLRDVIAIHIFFVSPPLELRSEGAHSGRRISCRAAVSLRFQFWNGHEIPRVFYLFPGLPGLKGTRPLAASRVLHSRTKNRIFNRFSLLHLEAPGRVSSSLLSPSLSLSLSPFPLSLVEISSLPELYVADVKEKYERLKSPR